MPARFTREERNPSDPKLRDKKRKDEEDVGDSVLDALEDKEAAWDEGAELEQAMRSKAQQGQETPVGWDRRVAPRREEEQSPMVCPACRSGQMVGPACNNCGTTVEDILNKPTTRDQGVMSGVLQYFAQGPSYPPGVEAPQEGFGGASQPPQGGIPEHQVAAPYNPTVYGEMAEGMHPAAQRTYELALRSGTKPEDAIQQAQQTQQQMLERAQQGQDISQQVEPVIPVVSAVQDDDDEDDEEDERKRDLAHKYREGWDDEEQKESKRVDDPYAGNPLAQILDSEFGGWVPEAKIASRRRSLLGSK